MITPNQVDILTIECIYGLVHFTCDVPLKVGQIISIFSTKLPNELVGQYTIVSCQKNLYRTNQPYPSGAKSLYISPDIFGFLHQNILKIH